MANVVLFSHLRGFQEIYTLFNMITCGTAAPTVAHPGTAFHQTVSELAAATLAQWVRYKTHGRLRTPDPLSVVQILSLRKSVNLCKQIPSANDRGSLMLVICPTAPLVRR